MTTRTHERWRDIALDAMASDVDEVSLHTDQPDSSGAEEVSGGDYSRQSISWEDADGGSVGSSEEVQFDVPGGTTVRYVGFRDEDGNWLGALALASEESFSEAGVYELESVDLSLYNQDNGNND